MKETFSKNTNWQAITSALSRFFLKIDKKLNTGFMLESAPPPSRLTVGTTAKCNLRCRMCFLHDTDATQYPDMDFALYKSISKDLFPYLRSIELSVMGEPMLSRNFVKELALARQYPINVCMTTNATALGSDKMRELVVQSIDTLMVSFDAATKETFEDIRIGANFDKVVANLKKLKELRESTGKLKSLEFNYVAMKRNLHELPLWVVLIHSLGANKAKISPMVPHITHSPEFAQEALENYPDQARHFIKIAISKANEIGLPLDCNAVSKFLIEPAAHKPVEHIQPVQAVQPALNNTPVPKPPAAVTKQRMHCHLIYEGGWINVDGTVMTCCAVGQQVAGNIKNESFSKIWNNDVYPTLRRQIHDGDIPKGCQGCYHLQTHP